MTLVQKLIQVYEKIDHVEKTGHNDKQNYDFLRAADMVRAVRKALLELGVYVETNFVNERQYTIARAKEPSAPFAAVDVRCIMTFHDSESGETLTASGLGTGADTGDKAVYKAQTGATKYALKSAFLIPDEADPEADETVDEGSQTSRGVVQDDEPSFMDAQRGGAAPIPTLKPKAAAARPTQAPEASKPAITEPTSTTSAASVAPAATPSTTVAVSPAEQVSGREPGDDMPTEEEMAEIRKKFRALGDDLADPNKGNMKTSKGLPVNRKVHVFLLQITKAPVAEKITKAQWDNFYARVDAAIQLENGWKGLAKLVNKANGIETK